MINLYHDKRASDKCIFSPLPNDRILDQSNLKAFADDILHVPQMMNYVPENAGYQHFLLLRQSSQKAPFPGSLTVRILW